MRHVNYKLKPAAINNAKPEQKAYSLTDGGGLLVEILPSGTKVWRYKYHLGEKREKVTLGRYPGLGIADARDQHAKLMALVERGESPARAKQNEAAAGQVAAARAETFEAYAKVWIHETLAHRTATYRAQIIRWLDAHVYPEIGGMPLGDVKPAHVLAIIERRKKHPTTADRVRVIVQQIYNHAIRNLRADSNPAAPLRGAVVVPPKTHAKHLTELQLGEFWRTIDKQGRAHATTLMASKLLALTMVRKMELLRAKKTEFDLDAAVWDIPAERMKMRKPHRVYLSRQAVGLLRHLFHFTQASVYVVPSISRASLHMAEVTLNHFFKRMDFGVPEFSPHGLRGTAATLLREHGFGKDVVELLLAHEEADKTAASYSHHELPEERRRALQFLADRIDRLAAGAEVVPIRVCG